MKITVNGKSEELLASLTIADYLKIKGYDTKLVVIEWNFTTYPKEEWQQIFLGDDDNLEIIKIVGGG
jgi:thiamine biosynthesis protein ThiS